jgi:hypothetical protein
VTEISISSDDDYLDQVLKFWAMDDDAFEMAKEEPDDASDDLSRMISAYCQAQYYRKNGQAGN